MTGPIKTETIVLERLRSTIRLTLDPRIFTQSTDIKSYVDMMTENVIYQFEATFLGQKSDLRVFTTYSNAIPATFLDWIKAALFRVFPFGCFLPKMQQVRTEHHYHETRVCPHINVKFPDDQHIVHLTRPLTQDEATARIEGLDEGRK